jgi:hypothetical protein
VSDRPDQEPPPALDDEIHSKIVQHPLEDIEGLLAYGIFKQSERDWIRRFHAAEGRPPTTAETTSHFYRSYDEGDIERLRTEAESKMLSFALSILDSERPKIEADAATAEHDSQLDAIRDEIRKAGGFGRAIVAGVISSFVFAVLILAFVATWYAPGVRDIIRGMTQ